MSSPINNIVKEVGDQRAAHIKLVLMGGKHHNCACTFKVDAPPNFYLVFPPNTLPERIDHSAYHPVSIKRENSTTSLNAKIIEQSGDRTLYLAAKNTVDPASLREYFRINTATNITVSHTSSLESSGTSNWSISGNTQDISGSGVLALFPDEPRSRDHLVMELYLPDKNVTVNAVGHIVRKKRLRNRKWQVAFHFDSISTKHRDAIITFLLSVQRKQLRENVRAFNH